MTDWIFKAHDKLDLIATSGKVSTICIHNARNLIKILHSLQIKPYRIITNADSEISILFRTTSGGRATIEVDDSEDGTLLLATREYFEGSPFEGSPKEILHKLKTLCK